MKVLSIDVSASSLRVLKVCHDKAGFHYETIYRVPNDMVYVDGHYHWDNEKILKGIQKGIVKACQEDPEIQSVGIDTWGVDYVPLDEKEIPLPWRCAIVTNVAKKRWKPFSEKPLIGKFTSKRGSNVATSIRFSNFTMI